MSSNGLNLCNKVEKTAKAAGAVIGLLVGYKVFSALSYVKEATTLNHNVVREGRSFLIVLIGTVIAAGFAYLLVIGAAAGALDVYKKNKLRWSIYRTSADGKRTCVAEDLAHEEMTVQMSQMSNQDSGAVYEGLPE